MSMIPIMGFFSGFSSRLNSTFAPKSTANFKKQTSGLEKDAPSLVDEKNQILVKIGQMVERLKAIESELQLLSKSNQK